MTGLLERLRHALTAASFQRGLALGAFVGAAIAGSTLWSRLRAGRSGPSEAPADRDR